MRGVLASDLGIKSLVKALGPTGLHRRPFDGVELR